MRRRLTSVASSGAELGVVRSLAIQSSVDRSTATGVSVAASLGKEPALEDQRVPALEGDALAGVEVVGREYGT